MFSNITVFAIVHGMLQGRSADSQQDYQRGRSQSLPLRVVGLASAAGTACPPACCCQDGAAVSATNKNCMRTAGAHGKCSGRRPCQRAGVGQSLRKPFRRGRGRGRGERRGTVCGATHIRGPQQRADAQPVGPALLFQRPCRRRRYWCETAPPVACPGHR